MANAKPTPADNPHGLPWVVCDRGLDGWCVRNDGGDGEKMFDDGSAAGEYGTVCSVETRDFILRCVNTAPDLLAAIKSLVRVSFGGPTRAEFAAARAAIAKAEPKTARPEDEIGNISITPAGIAKVESMKKKKMEGR